MSTDGNVLLDSISSVLYEHVQDLVWRETERSDAYIKPSDPEPDLELPSLPPHLPRSTYLKVLDWELVSYNNNHEFSVRQQEVRGGRDRNGLSCPRCA